MIARARALSRRTIEVGVVIAVYLLFLIVGVYGGQTTMNVDSISPSNGLELRSSPVELAFLERYGKPRASLIEARVFRVLSTPTNQMKKAAQKSGL